MNSGDCFNFLLLRRCSVECRDVGMEAKGLPSQ